VRERGREKVREREREREKERKKDIHITEVRVKIETFVDKCILTLCVKRVKEG
jgi:hypothetical protein